MMRFAHGFDVLRTCVRQALFGLALIGSCCATNMIGFADDLIRATSQSLCDQQSLFYLCPALRASFLIYWPAARVVIYCASHRVCDPCDDLLRYAQMFVRPIVLASGRPGHCCILVVLVPRTTSYCRIVVAQRCSAAACCTSLCFARLRTPILHSATSCLDCRTVSPPAHSTPMSPVVTINPAIFLTHLLRCMRSFSPLDLLFLTRRIVRSSQCSSNTRFARVTSVVFSLRSIYNLDSLFCSLRSQVRE